MNSKELRGAFIDETPVKYKGAIYKKINRISFLKSKEGNVVEHATLVDLCGRSEVTFPGKDVESCEN